MSGEVTEAEAAELIVRLCNLGLSVKQAFAIGDILDEKLAARDAEWVAVIDGMVKENTVEASICDRWDHGHLAGYTEALDELKARMTGEK